MTSNILTGILSAELLALLRCVAPQPSRIEPCSGTLERVADQLVCLRCQRAYPLRNEIPDLRPDPDRADQYSQMSMIHQYYEQQFSTYIQVADLQERLRYAPQNIRNAPPASADDAAVCVATELHVSESFYRKMTALAADVVPRQGIVLDVGCGLGRTVVDLARTSRLSIGLDSSPLMAAEARRLALTSGKVIDIKLPGIVQPTDARLSLPEAVTNVQFLLGDGERLCFPEGTFDVVTCINVVDRVSNPARLIDELHRVLKSGTGRLLVSDPYDWEESPTPLEDRLSDMKVLLGAAHWEIEEEIDATPFMVRPMPRRVATYMNHTLVCRRR